MGYFISFEGPEGSGKSTQVKLLEQELTRRGFEVVLSHEPGGGTGFCTRIRELLLSAKEKPGARTELFLMMAARAEHVDVLLKPALERGAVIICDRFMDSSVAYQGYGRELDLQWIHSCNQIAIDGLSPDLTIVMDISPEDGLRRAMNSGLPDRIESEKMEFHQRVRKGFLELVASEERFHLFDATESVKAIHEKILSILPESLNRKIS
jgi:dTMP kinase